MPQPLMPSLRERMNLWALIALFVAGVGVMLACHSMLLPLSVQEQRFVAAGAVAARQGQWPVRDYAFFDMPALAAAYAGLFKFTATLMPAARLSSAVAALLVATLLFLTALRRLDAVTTLGRFGLAASAAVLLLTSPIFLRVTGQARPDDLAALGAVAGVLAAMAAVRAGASRPALAWGIVAGLCIGSAASLRVLYAPLVLVLAALLPLTPGVNTRQRLASFALFLAAVAAALIPTWLLIRRTPDVLWFATAEHSLVQWFRTGSLTLPDMWASQQQVWMLRELGTQTSTLVLLVALGGLLAVSIMVLGRAARAKRPGHVMVELAMAAGATAVTVVMGYLCTPASTLHLFAALPLAILTCVMCAAYLRQYAGERARVMATTLYLGATVAVLVPGVQEWSVKLRYFSYERTPVARHVTQARELGRTVSDGHVLTLDPLVALEAGARIYPALLMGEVTWRWGASMSDPERARLSLITPAQLGTLVKEHPPAAVMVSESPTRAQQPLLSYIHYHRFRKQPLPSGDTLWVPRFQTAGVQSSRR